LVGRRFLTTDVVLRREDEFNIEFSGDDVERAVMCEEGIAPILCLSTVDAVRQLVFAKVASKHLRPPPRN